MKEHATPIQELTTPATQTKERSKKRISTAKALCLYVFLGTLIGDVIILLATLFAEFSTRNLNDLDSYKFILIFSLISYPVALIIGGIPALISGALINVGDSPKSKYIRAGAIGFVVSVLFYAMFLDGFNKQSAVLGLLGAIAAIGTRFRISQIENRV